MLSETLVGWQRNGLLRRAAIRFDHYLQTFPGVSDQIERLPNLVDSKTMSGQVIHRNSARADQFHGFAHITGRRAVTEADTGLCEPEFGQGKGNFHIWSPSSKEHDLSTGIDITKGSFGGSLRRRAYVNAIGVRHIAGSKRHLIGTTARGHLKAVDVRIYS